jgi:hypothetical protein
MKPELALNSVELRKRLIDIGRKNLFDRGFEYFESLFLKTNDMSSEIQYAKIQADEFPKGYGLLTTKASIRVSKGRYGLKHLLKYVGRNIEDFTNIYRVMSGYDVVVYGYTDDESDAFLVVGTRIAHGSPMYYHQGDINTTKQIFQEIQEWFRLQEALREKSEKQQGQNNVAV